MNHVDRVRKFVRAYENAFDYNATRSIVIENGEFPELRLRDLQFLLADAERCAELENL